MYFFRAGARTDRCDRLTLDEAFPSVEALRQHLAARNDRWALALEEGKLLAAVNQTLVSFDTPYRWRRSGVFPPVTGG
jgi:molybdopterin synthase sulfur carrier subunit